MGPCDLEGTIPEIGDEVHWGPSTSGCKSWRAMSYDPEMETFFIPINLNCETVVFGPLDRVAGAGGASRGGMLPAQLTPR